MISEWGRGDEFHPDYSLVSVATSSSMIHLCILLEYDASPQHTNNKWSRQRLHRLFDYIARQPVLHPSRIPNTSPIFRLVLIAIITSHIVDLSVIDMPSEQDPWSMSTPNCPGEERAWLLVYLERIGYGKQLSRAFNKQFASERSNRSVLYHARDVKSCDTVVKSQLLDLAKSLPW